MSNIQVVEAYILKKIPHGNSSWILQIFTSTEGRYALLAKGARKSKKANLYEYFNHLELSVIRREGLSLLTDVASLQKSHLKKDALWLGFYLNELLLRLLGQDLIDQMLFESYHQTIIGLEQAEDSEPLLRHFETSLLEALGVMPDFSVDVMQQPIDEAAEYGLMAEGLVLMNDVLRTSSLIASQMIQGSTILQIQENLLLNQPLDVVQRKVYKRIMRALIQYQLGDKPLHSRKWFEHLKQSPNKE